MMRSLEMPITDGRTDRCADVWTYRQDQIYRTPVDSAGGLKMFNNFNGFYPLKKLFEV